MSCISLLTLTSVGAATNTDRYHDFGSRAGEAVQLTEVMGSLPSKGSIRLQHAERTLARISARNMRDTVALFERRTSMRTRPYLRISIGAMAAMGQPRSSGNVRYRTALTP